MGKNRNRWVHCAECRRNLLHCAHGLCQQCYDRQYHAERLEEEVERHRRHRAEHPERYAEYQRQYHAEHREERNEYRRQWRKDNADHVCAYNHQYQKTHQAERRGYSQRRNARKAALPATLTEAEWQEILEEYNYRCAYCGCDDVPLEQEHKIPVFKGGGYTKDNIVPACRACNLQKGTKTYEEFRLSQGGK